MSCNVADLGLSESSIFALYTLGFGKSRKKEEYRSRPSVRLDAVARLKTERR